MADLLDQLAELLRMKKQQAPAPAVPDINEARPWDSPVLQQQMPQALGGAPGIAVTQPETPMTPVDDALVQALLKKRINQEFAKAGNQPIPE